MTERKTFLVWFVGGIAAWWVFMEILGWISSNVSGLGDFLFGLPEKSILLSGGVFLVISILKRAHEIRISSRVHGFIGGIFVGASLYLVLAMLAFALMEH